MSWMERLLQHPRAIMYQKHVVFTGTRFGDNVSENRKEAFDVRF